MLKVSSLISIVSLASVFLSGCTSLTHEPLNDSDAQTKPGFPYYLPKQTYTITVVYELTSCKGQEITASQTATITENTVADRSEHYIIPYESMDGLLKTTSFNAAAYPNGTLKSVGASIEDRTGPFIKSTVGTAISIAKMAMGVFTADANVCNSIVTTSLENLRQARDALLKLGVEDKARSAAAAVVESERSSLQIKKVYNFDPSAGHLSQPVGLDDSDLEKWFSNAKAIAKNAELSAKKLEAKYADEAKVAAANGTEASIETDDEKFLDATRTYIEVIPAATGLASFTSSEDSIVWRDPIQATINVYAGLRNDRKKLSNSVDTLIAQLGRKMFVSLRNGVFDKNNITLSFGVSGQLETIAYGNEASLEKLAAALADTSSQSATFLGQVRAEDEAQHKSASTQELDQIKAQLDLTKAKADLIEQQQRLEKLGGQ